jgi:hypothetical protein
MPKVEVLLNKPNGTLEFMLIDEKDVNKNHIRLPIGEDEQVANFYIYDSENDHEYFTNEIPVKSHHTILWDRNSSSDYLIEKGILV